MAARFPQGTGSLSYRIKPAWASKIKAIFWAVGADAAQMLRSGDSVTTPLSRAASGATWDAANGRITGTNINNTYFSYEQAGGFGIAENGAFTFGASAYGDLFNGVPVGTLIGTISDPATPTADGFRLYVNTYTMAGEVEGGYGSSGGGAFSNDVVGWMSSSWRHDQSDPTADVRTWWTGDASGATEQTSMRASSSASSTTIIGDTGNPIKFGHSGAGSGNTSLQFEACWLCGSLSDADMATITSDPASIIEVAAATINLTPDPTTVVVGSTRTFTITRTIAAGAGGVTYNLSSSNTGVATVPATATITEGNTSITFDATGTGVGSANITATNAADSGETDTAALTASAPTTTTLKLLAHIDALGATAVKGAVFQPGTGGNLLGAKIGDFTGEAFEATPEGGQAPLLVPVTSFGGGALTVSDTPVCVWEATTASGSALGNGVAVGSVGPHECTVVEI